MSTAELATSYAALILADDGVEITVCAHHNKALDRRTALLMTGIGREAPDSHHRRQGSRSRANLDDSVRKGTWHKIYKGTTEHDLIDGTAGS